jgi:hypothetical protein
MSEKTSKYEELKNVWNYCKLNALWYELLVADEQKIKLVFLLDLLESVN